MNWIFFLNLLSTWQQLVGPYTGCITSIETIDGYGDTIFVTTMYSIDGGVYRSIDEGQTWQQFSSGIDPKQGYGMNRIIVCPNDHSLMLCGTGFFGSNIVYRSTDAGQNWVQTAYNFGPIADMKFFPGSDQELLLIAYEGIYKSTDGGITWASKHSTSVGSAIWFKHDNADTIFAGHYFGLLASTDQGETWITTPFTNPVYDITADPQAPDSLYIAAHVAGVYSVTGNGGSSVNLGLSGRYNTTIFFEPTYHKIYVGGFYYNGRICVSDNLGGSWYEYRSDQLFDYRINDIEVPASNPDKVIAACYDAGVSIMQAPDSTWNLSSTGICQGTIRAIAVAPSDPNIIYVSMSTIGVWRSSDGGNTWTTNPQSLTWLKFHETEYIPPGLAVSPKDPNTIYASFQIDLASWPALYRSVLKSTDGGWSWIEENEGLEIIPPDFWICCIAIHPENDSIIYLATTYGAFRSTDAGATWIRRSDHYIYWIEIDPVEPNRLYATGPGRVYYSEDNGETWENRSTGLSEEHDVMMVDIDPHEPNRVYAALCGLEQPQPTSGIYVSDNYAIEWFELPDGLPEVIRRPRIMVDTINTYVWATTPLLGEDVPGVFYSTNKGANWLAGDEGLNTNRTMFLAMGSHPLLGTQGNGIWQWLESAIVDNSQTQNSRLFHLYPNPTHGKININYYLPQTGKVEIKIIDVAGRVMRNVLDEVLSPGNYMTTIQLDIPAGVYFVNVETEGSTSTAKFLLIH